jgi:hypothetical protein
METPTYEKPQRLTVFVADLKCYLCGTVAGSIESEQAPAAQRTVLLREPGKVKAAPVLDWRQMRCVRCGGPLYLDESDVVTRRVDEYNWTDERPRRGRPPKRLIEERRREREQALASQAA